MMCKEWLSPLPLVGLGVPVGLTGARQSRVLLSRWQKTSTSLRGNWLWHGEHWQHLGVSGAVKVAVPPCPKRPLGLYLEHGGISWPRAALWTPWAAGAAGGRRELLQERTAVGGWSVQPHPARMTADPRAPLSPAAEGQSWVLFQAAGASPSGCGGHGGCGHSGAGAGCHRSCGWLCGMDQLGCHH